MRGLARSDSIAALALFLGGVFYLWQATMYSYGAESGVGEGFLPFWLGLALTLCALLLLYRSVKGEAEVRSTSCPGRNQALLLAGCIVAFIPVADRLGAAIGIFLLTAVSTWILGSRWWVSTLVAAILAGAIHVLFQRWLGVPLPVGPLGI